MAGKGGSAAATLQPCEEQALRSHIESAVAGKTNLTNDQLVDLLCSAFPQSYSRRHRKLLTERLAKITPLPCRRDDAIDEPTPVAKKRQKIDETRRVSRQNKVLSPSISGDGDYGSEDDDLWELDVSGGSDELGNDRRDINKDGGGGLRDVSGNKRPMFSDLWGMDFVIDQLKSAAMPLLQTKLLRHLGVESIPRILLHGPSGCGKTTLARAVANWSGFPFYQVSAVELVSGDAGAAEENIRELFSTAYTRAPSIVFIDEIDAMTSKTESLQKEIEPRIVNQLMACMDEPYRLIKPINHDADSESCNSRPAYVLVIGATNRLDALDPALRRRFDRAIVIRAPCDYARSQILSVLTHSLKVDDGLDLKKLARCTHGFVAGDLIALVKKASMLAVTRIMVKRMNEAYTYESVGLQYKDCRKQPFPDEELKNVSLTMKDFVEAGKMVQPSSEMERFSTTPKAKWEDVGGLESLKLVFERYIIQPIKFPEVYKDLGLYLMTYFLLVGPSGCGKTLIVEALANEAGANFLHIKGRELVYLDDGLGEMVVRILFSYARTHSPCIIFFDELDVIACRRDGQQLPVYSELVSELYSKKRGSGVYVIAATNRLDLEMQIWSELKMFDKVLRVPHPTPEGRGAILKALARNKPIDANVDLMALGKDAALKNFSGADLSALMQGALQAAIGRPTLPGEDCRVLWTIKDVDFKSVLNKMSPSVPRTVLLVCYCIFPLSDLVIPLMSRHFWCSKYRIGSSLLSCMGAEVNVRR